MRLIDADALLDELPIHPDGGMRSVKGEGLMIRVRNTVKIAPTVGGWVSVKDKLPEVNEKCLIMDKTDVTVGRLIDKEQRIWQWEDSDFYGRGGITHWMPLLEPPEEVNEDA